MQVFQDIFIIIFLFFFCIFLRGKIVRQKFLLFFFSFIGNIILSLNQNLFFFKFFIFIRLIRWFWCLWRFFWRNFIFRFFCYLISRFFTKIFFWSLRSCRFLLHCGWRSIFSWSVHYFFGAPNFCWSFELFFFKILKFLDLLPFQAKIKKNFNLKNIFFYNSKSNIKTN